MSRRARDPFSSHQNLRAEQQHQAKRDRHRSSPCGGVPVVIPKANITIFWSAAERKNRLEYRIRARWTPPTEDTDGFPLDPSEYEAQAQAVKADGTDADSIALPTDPVTYKKALRKKKVGAPTDADDYPAVDFGRATNPKSWRWKVRVRSANANGCYGDWSEWTDAVLPGNGETEPLPPAPTFVSMDFSDEDKYKGQKYHLKVTFTPVRNWDVPGGDTEDDLARYAVRLEVLRGDTGSDWQVHATRLVEDKDESDQNETNSTVANKDITVRFNRIRRGDRYRVYLRSIDRFNRRGNWAGPYPVGGTKKDVTADQIAKVTGVVRTRLGPRRIQWDWDEVENTEVDRYKVIIAKADTSGGSFVFTNPTKTGWPRLAYTKASYFRLAVAETDKTKFFKARVYAEGDIAGDGTRPISPQSDEETSGEGVDDFDIGSSYPTAVPANPPTPTVRRRVKSLVVRWEQDPAADTEPVTYEVHVSTTNNFTPVSTGATKTRVGQTKGDRLVVTQFYNGSTIADLTASQASTTLYVKLRAKNFKDGTLTYSAADSAQVTSAANDADYTDQDTDTNGATVAPNTPTNVVVKARPRALVIRWQDDASEAQSPIRYEVHIAVASGFTPSATTRVGITRGTTFISTQHTNGGVLQEFIRRHGTTAFTFYVKIVAKNKAGSATSAEASGRPAAALKGSTSTSTTDDNDVMEVIANRFIADDGLGDRITISDTTADKAKIKFVGSSGTTTMTVGTQGNVTVSGGYMSFSSGLVLPLASVATATGSVYFDTSTNTLYIKKASGWRAI